MWPSPAPGTYLWRIKNYLSPPYASCVPSDQEPTAPDDSAFAAVVSSRVHLEHLHGRDMARILQQCEGEFNVSAARMGHDWLNDIGVRLDAAIRRANAGPDGKWAGDRLPNIHSESDMAGEYGVLLKYGMLALFADIPLFKALKLDFVTAPSEADKADPAWPRGTARAGVMHELKTDAAFVVEAFQRLVDLLATGTFALERGPGEEWRLRRTRGWHQGDMGAAWIVVPKRVAWPLIQCLGHILDDYASSPPHSTTCPIFLGSTRAGVMMVIDRSGSSPEAVHVGVSPILTFTHPDDPLLCKYKLNAPVSNPSAPTERQLMARAPLRPPKFIPTHTESEDDDDDDYDMSGEPKLPPRSLVLRLFPSDSDDSEPEAGSGAQVDHLDILMPVPKIATTLPHALCAALYVRAKNSMELDWFAA